MIKTLINISLLSLVGVVMLLNISQVIAEPKIKIKIGVSTALTGNVAIYGIDIRNTIQFANEKLANNAYELIIEDDKCSSKDAALIAKKFINVDNIKYVTGLPCSSSVFASAPLYEEAGVIAIAPSASAPAISHAGDYIFRTWPNDEEAARVLFNYVKDHHKVFGIITEETDYAQAMTDAMTKESKNTKVKIISDNFLSTDTDFKNQILRMKSQGIDGLFINAQTEATYLLLFKQAGELKLNVPLYGAFFPGSETFLKIAGTDADGIIFVDTPNLDDKATPEGRMLYEEFKREYGRIKSINSLFVFSYEAFRSLHMAIQSGIDAREFLYTTSFNGPFGEWHYDKNGDIVGMPHVLRTIRDGKVVALSLAGE